MVIGCHREHAADESQNEVVLQVDRLRFAEQHPQPGDDKERPKNKKNKMKARDERNAQPDHGGPHHKRAQDSPDQDPVLVARRDPEVGENQTEDKNVINAERVFDQVTGKEIDRLVGALQPPDEGVESQGETDPEKAAPDRTGQTDALVRPIAEKIDEERDENPEMKGDPEPNADRHEALGFHG